MRVIVSAEVLADDGTSLIAYSRTENSVIGDDLQGALLNALILVREFSAEAAERLGLQAQTHLVAAGAAQAEIDKLRQEGKI